MADKQIVDRRALRGMSAEEIQTALREGRLDLLLRGNDAHKGAKLSDQQRAVVLAHASAADVQRWQQDGTLDALTSEAPTPSADQGARGGTAAYATRAWVKQASPDEIAEALRKGNLDPQLRGDLKHLR
jgi:hypothetical protein